MGGPLRYGDNKDAQPQHIIWTLPRDSGSRNPGR